MDSIQSQQHLCEELKTLKEKHEYTVDIFFRPVMTSLTSYEVIPNMFQFYGEESHYIATQIDFCPFCGEELSSFLRKIVSMDNEQNLVPSAYFEYRKRFTSSERNADSLLGQEAFEAKLRDLEELAILIPHAKEQHISSLKNEREKLRDILCLNQSLEESLKELRPENPESKNDLESPPSELV